MKRFWVFTEDSLNNELADWIKKQRDTAHPAAMANVEFVATAIKDFLFTSKSLFKGNNNQEQKAETNEG